MPSLAHRYAAALRAQTDTAAARLALVREALMEAGSVAGAARLLGVAREHVRSLLGHHPELDALAVRGRGRPAANDA